MKTVLITGVNGQDGSYLAEHLLGLNCRVVGTVRSPASDLSRIHHLRSSLQIVETDLRASPGVERLIAKVQPAEIYNLAARASGSELWADPVSMGEVNGLLVTRLLQAIVKINPTIRFCQASSSEIFGHAVESPQSEITPLAPRNPYGCAKAYAHWVVGNFREVHGLFACSAILYNHESPRRGPEAVTQKIAQAVAQIRYGLAKELPLGNLEARRDWGFAGDYVKAMAMMLSHDAPGDYVVATGEAHSVREFCEAAFSHAGLDFEPYVKPDPASFRQEEKTLLVGNPAKARRVLGWKPTLSFQDIARMMVDAEMRSVHAVVS